MTICMTEVGWAQFMLVTETVLPLEVDFICSPVESHGGFIKVFRIFINVEVSVKLDEWMLALLLLLVVIAILLIMVILSD